MYDIFGKYGAIRQIRLWEFVFYEHVFYSFFIWFCLNFFLCRGDKQDTRGTAFVVYEDIYDANTAVDHLSGFNVCGRYLIVLYYQQARMQKVVDNNAKRKEIDDMKAKFGVEWMKIKNIPHAWIVHL